MGWSMTAAHGVKLAYPDRPVISFTGDGDFMMTMQELSTAAQYQLPVITAVMNNSGWMAIKALQLASFGDKSFTFANDFTNLDGSRYLVDYVKLAESMGVTAWRVTKLEEVKPAIQRALHQKGPVLIDFIISNEFPYGDGDSTGWWDMPVPAYIPGGMREEYLKGVAQEFI